LAQNQREAENGNGSFVDSLHEMQGEYIMLNDLYEKQKNYGQKLWEMMSALQYEVDVTIPIRPEIMGDGYTAAYLVSEAVVIAFDKNRNMTSSPLYRLPAGTIISVIEECAPELRRLISEKRRNEGTKVRSLERVLKELKKAQATFKQTRRDELDAPEEEEPKEEVREVEEEETPKKAPEQPEPQPRTQKDSFAFKGSFGAKRELPGISP
jgi:Sec-independent protein translocase protein TatA